MLLPLPSTAQWPRLETLPASVPIPEGYNVRPITRQEVATVVERLRAWYPDVVVGAESCHTDEAFWHEQVMLQGEESSGKGAIVPGAPFRISADPDGSRGWRS